ncbi:MAG TPA: XrtA/PEP-CTERM system histidine kinase PrsK [Allosphingosinicella sp.]|nr:XrtA/PEP-CTERM system histidine kinase PrsK [Allosphingosinicella sp.]
MIVLLGFWTHALAALLYGALALWQLRRWNEDRGNRRLVAAFAVTSAWAIFIALQGPHSLGAGLAEAARNFAFLGFMYAIVSRAADERGERGVKLVYTVVAGVIGLQLTLAGVIPSSAGNAVLHEALVSTAQVIGLTIAAGSLILVHNLYGQAAHESRWGIRLPMIALAGMWAYDLHLYTVGWLTRGPVDDLYAMRGAILSLLVPLFALASRRNSAWRMQLSRAATFQSLSLIAILGYLILMMTASRALEVVGGNWVRIGQVGLVFAITVAAVILLPSGRMRAWSRVIVAKHFFEHRYDYREEWLRFTRTVGGDAPLGERIIKAIADIAESPSGLLLVPEGGRLSVAARWNWRDDLPEASAEDAELIRLLETSGHVLDFTGLGSARLKTQGPGLRVPASLAALEAVWAGVPLIHGDRLVGLVLLEHPLVRRPLDWEDFDLFRTVGIQAASYLAEARTQDALADARRFDEFNRRFAFIIHDIKNLVSQLSLVIRNAERHADNPEFREDMIATLHSSVKKMNDLLARLHRGGSNVEAEPVRAIPLRQAVAAVAEVKRRVHPVEVEGSTAVAAVADPVRLEQALAHLVQNAIDASPSGSPVRIRCGARGNDAVVEIIDRGEGMSADFIRTRLFQPFASTKESGFGVGAFEARSLVAAMGGRIEVDSREGEGSRFTILLPLGETSFTEIGRMRA